jgi:hypothetical protein
MLLIKYSNIFIKLIGIEIVFSLIGCSFNVPEFKGVKATNGDIIANYDIAKSNDAPPSANKLIVENDQISNVQMTNAPVLKINQQWTYINNDLNTSKTIKVLEVNDSYYIIKEGVDEIKYDKNMKIIDIVYPPNKDYEKHWVKYNFPMYVGKQWEYDAYIMVKSEDKLYKAHVNSEVISYGNVSVKAGIFKAYKIFEQMIFQKIMALSYYWYAPDIGVIVKSVPRSKLPVVSDIELI